MARGVGKQFALVHSSIIYPVTDLSVDTKGDFPEVTDTGDVDAAGRLWVAKVEGACQLVVSGTINADLSKFASAGLGLGATGGFSVYIGGTTGSLICSAGNGICTAFVVKPPVKTAVTVTFTLESNGTGGFGQGYKL